MCSELCVVTSAPSACIATAICASPLPTGVTGRALGVERLQFVFRDPNIKLENCVPRVLVYLYAKKVVQMACKLDTTNRVI